MALHYKSDGTLDMRYKSSKAVMRAAHNPSPSPSPREDNLDTIPKDIPVTNSGIPDMRTKLAKQWVGEQAQRDTEEIPPWLPRTKDGSLDISKAIVQEYYKSRDITSSTYLPDQRLIYYSQKLNDVSFRTLVQDAREEQVQMPLYEMLPTTSDLQHQFSSQEDHHEDLCIEVPLLDYEDLTINPDEQLGHGSFGTVYKGTWNNQIVAIKQLHVNQLTRQEQKSFLKEIQIMSILGEHPNLVLLHGYTLEPPCLVMEYVQLGSLSYLLHFCEDEQIEAKLTDGRIKKKLVLGIVLGMIQLHLLSVIHGDLKPQNILVTDDYTAKVTDFGFAILRYKTSSAMTSSDNEREIRGTAGYMAPELLDNSRPPSSSTDVYSFAVMLNEIIQEEEPYTDQIHHFAGRGPFGVVNYARLGHRPKINPRTPTFLKHFIEKCWNSQAKSRPTFAQIFKDLKPAHVKFPNSFEIFI